MILRDVNTVQNASYMKIKYLKQAKQKKAEKQKSREAKKQETHTGTYTTLTHTPPPNNKQYSLISVVFAKTSDFGGECLI